MSLLSNTCSILFHNVPLNIAKHNGFTLFGSKKKGSSSLVDDEDTAVSHDVLDRLQSDCKTKLKSIEDGLKFELSKISVHRAAPSLIDHENIERESGDSQLRHIASIVTRGNFELIVNPYKKADLTDIFTSLSTSLAGYKVKLLESYVSVTIPELGSDMRKKSQENVKRLLNSGLDQIRLTRQNSMKTLKNLESGLSQDMLFSQKKQIEGQIKSSTSNVEKMCNDKLSSL
ncbi:uncharacterized protein TOT_020000674 [Theileria orientalis strain Shintoku]|uniref:Ribosome recycling factor domain-containing protein n=1 Tax=Theileria orientalis strain Shintoku TaxID=869250 RepID=J4CD28_THEOR|nr:uncharacterized protein TOT_020000674 [Theileria orientalis strain Shintoku]BAM40417.1 uncharacterized protein TOT_020000674 [Theileria orientalis strain Shintoku]|eukprot:XP_009690718.1 uncharacterized protein TOT_020000674 [Theileria orientalis strain Shintoku]